jgi:hypothetical protein
MEGLASTRDAGATESMNMSTKQELEAAVAAAAKVLADTQAALFAWGALAENNTFATLEEALSAVEDKLQSEAFNDCEGAGNCGAPEYTQEFMVGDVKYLGKLACEYNRHDKMYYYVEESEFTHKQLEPVTA